MNAMIASHSGTLIKQVEQSYTDLLGAWQDVPLDTLLMPALPNGWSVKDTLAQIAAWVWRFASLLDHIHDSDVPLQATPDVDALKQEFFTERKEWSWRQVEADFTQAHQTLLTSLRRLPPQRLQDRLIQEKIAQEIWGRYAQYLPGLLQWYQQYITTPQPI